MHALATKDGVIDNTPATKFEGAGDNKTLDDIMSACWIDGLYTTGTYTAVYDDRAEPLPLIVAENTELTPVAPEGSPA